jgi:peptide deformylase
MAVRTVLKMGHPVLRQVAAPVARFDHELAALVADMDETMRSLSGAGIAAPQIGVSLRVVIFELLENPRYPHVSPVPYTVLVNPVLTPLGDEQAEGWEAGPRATLPQAALSRLRSTRRADRSHGRGISCSRRAA